MSWMTKYLDKPASVLSDAAVATAVGAAGMVVYPALLPVIPLVGGFAPLIAAPLAGVTGAAVYLRARQNLNKPPPLPS